MKETWSERNRGALLNKARRIPMEDNRWANGFLRWIAFGLMTVLMVACGGDEPPASPSLKIGEATEISRNGAKLSGSVSGTELTPIGTCSFHYGLSSGMEYSVEATQGATGKFEVLIEGLSAGCTYYYCMEISSGKSTLRSSMAQFQTLPNLVPTIGEVELVSKGPLSATVQCSIVDAGGEEFTRIGFLLSESGSTEETFVAATSVGDDSFIAQLGGLNMNTDYSVKACAANSLGEQQSEAITFQTNSAIQVSEAGTLPEIIGEEWKYQLTSITIAGELNGTDIRFLREMLGKKWNGEDTEGVLEVVNLADCRIVSGGTAYYISRYTSDDVLGSEMFRDCINLKEITLPQSIVTIEENAFQGCTSLESLTIPENVTSVGYSVGCTNLKTYAVSPLNTTFSVKDGILYSYDQTQLLLYPAGHEGDTFTFPEDVVLIGKNAFRESLLHTVVIPDQIKTMEDYAFAASALSSVQVGTGLSNLSVGNFQGCQSLTSVVLLGENLRRIGNYAFSGCTALAEISLTATYPPVCGTSTFASEIYDTCTVYVPSGCKSIYRSSSSWSGFSRVVESEN